MGRLLSKESVREICVGTALLCCALALVCWPREIGAAVQSGLELCYNVILPSLFPFFILTSLVISLGLAGYLGRLLEPVMRPLFHVSGPCAAALALGFVGGYPVGARAALTLYENGQCTKTEAERLLAADNSEPATVAQITILRASTPEDLNALAAEGADAAPHPWLPDCVTLTGGGDLEQLSVFRDGRLYIQDAAARLAVMAAAPRPGMRVLDACAAPGGKSFGTAIAMGDRGEVLSCDIHPHKKKLIDAGAQRLGLACIRSAVQDAKSPCAQWVDAFDLVITDVPCSGLGIIRKKPDIRYKEPGPLAGLPAVQRSILENVSAYVKPGGALLYCTCTLLERENGDVVSWFLDAHPDYHTEPFELPAPIGRAAEGRLTLWPHIHGTDGFYIAKLRRDL